VHELFLLTVFLYKTGTSEFPKILLEICDTVHNVNVISALSALPNHEICFAHWIGIVRKPNYSVRRAGKAISDVKRNIVGLDLGSAQENVRLHRGRGYRRAEVTPR
jgi:hypothetical protein